MRLQTEDSAASPLAALQLAATDEPIVHFSVSFGGLSTASLPGVESAIDYAIRTALRKVLVLPNRLPAVDPAKLVLPLSEAQRTAVGRSTSARSSVLGLTHPLVLLELLFLSFSPIITWPQLYWRER